MVSIIRGNRGQSVVEFAVVLPVLLLVLFGITEFGRALMVKNVLTSAAREGARLAIVTAPDENAVRERVDEVCRAAGITGAAVDISKPDEDDPRVRVTVTSQFTFIPGAAIFNVFGNDSFKGTIQIGSTSVMRHETLQP